MGIIGFLVFGLFVGVVARLLKPGKENLGWGGTLVLGILGSLVGGVIAKLLGTGDWFELNIIGGICAIIAAILLVGVAETLTGKAKS